MTIRKKISQKFSYGNAVPTQFLMWERRSHAFPPHYTTGYVVYRAYRGKDSVMLSGGEGGGVLKISYFSVIFNTALQHTMILQKVDQFYRCFTKSQYYRPNDES